MDSPGSTAAPALRVPEVAPEAAPAAGPTPTRQRSGRRAFLVLGALLALVLLGIGGYLVVNAGKETTDDAQVEADVVPLAARVGGAVQKVHVVDNQRVKAGQLLLELDPADFQARLSQARAELATAEAQAEAMAAQEEVVASSSRGGLSTAQAALSGSSVGVSAADAQVKAAEAALARAQAEAHRAQLDFERMEKLVAGGVVSQAQMDAASAAHASARAALAQSEANLAAAQEARRQASSRVAEAQGRVAQSGSVDAQLTAAHASTVLARAKAEAARAAVALAENQLAYTRVVAPADGVVSRLAVHEGQLVAPSQPLAQLVPTTTYVVANFKETQIGGMHAGDEVEVSLDAYPGHHLKGRVESLSAGTGARFSLLPPDNASGNFVKVVQRVPVRIAWEGHPDVSLQAGLSAEVTVDTRSGGH